MVIVTRNVDLSVGSVLGLSAYAAGLLFEQHPDVPILRRRARRARHRHGLRDRQRRDRHHRPRAEPRGHARDAVRDPRHRRRVGRRTPGRRVRPARQLQQDRLRDVPRRSLPRLDPASAPWRSRRTGCGATARGATSTRSAPTPRPRGSPASRSAAGSSSPSSSPAAIAGVAGVLWLSKYGSVDAIAGPGLRVPGDRRGRRRRRRDLRRQRAPSSARRSARCSSTRSTARSSSSTSGGHPLLELDLGRGRSAAPGRDRVRPADLDPRPAGPQHPEETPWLSRQPRRPTTPRRSRRGARRSARSSAGRRCSCGVLVGTILYGISVSPAFWTSSTFFYVGLNIGEVAIMALPVALIVITGEIDLSIAAILGLTGVVMAEALLARLVALAGDGRRARGRAACAARSTASSSPASACRRSRSRSGR